MTAEDIHAPNAPGRAYCGRKSKNTNPSWKHVTCVECKAAARADGKDQP